MEHVLPCRAEGPAYLLGLLCAVCLAVCLTLSCAVPCMGVSGGSVTVEYYDLVTGELVESWSPEGAPGTEYHRDTPPMEGRVPETLSVHGTVPTDGRHVVTTVVYVPDSTGTHTLVCTDPDGNVLTTRTVSGLVSDRVFVLELPSIGGYTAPGTYYQGRIGGEDTVAVYTVDTGDDPVATAVHDALGDDGGFLIICAGTVACMCLLVCAVTGGRR